MAMADPSSSDNSEWEIVVPALPQEKAERRFRLWMKGQQAKGRTVQSKDVRRDQIFKGPGEGCAVRYLVRKSPV